MIPIRRRQAVPRDEVLAIFATAPVIDIAELNADLDAAVAQDLREAYDGTTLVTAHGIGVLDTSIIAELAL
jgi:hypothetical protein